MPCLQCVLLNYEILVFHGGLFKYDDMRYLIRDFCTEIYVEYQIIRFFKLCDFAWHKVSSAMFPKKLSSSAMVPEKVIMSFERVFDALKGNDSRYLRSNHDQFSQKILSMRFLSSGEHLLLLKKSIFRDIGAELYIPNCLKKSKHTTALRSEATGNCL